MVHVGPIFSTLGEQFLIMKKLFLFVLLLVSAIGIYAQDINTAVRSYPGKVKYQKTEHDCTIFEMPYPKDQVEEGMKKLMEERGAKVREKNGFYEVKNISIVKLQNKVCDGYYKIEKDGKTGSRVYLILAEPGEDLGNRTSNHAVVAAAAGGVALASAMGSSLDDHNFDVQVKQQEEDLKSAEKKLNKLQDDQKNLQKKLSDLQTSIDKNSQDQTRMQKEIEAKRATLESFKAGRKGKKD